MSMEPDIHDEVSRVRDKVSDLELSTTRKLGEIETSVRLAKHDNSNTQQMVIGITTRMDRMESSFKSEMKEFRDDVGKEFRLIAAQLTADVKGLSAEISSNNTKSERNFGFYAGIAATGTFVVTLSGVIIAAVIKIMGGN